MKKYMKQKWMLAACTASLTLCAFGLVGVGAFAEETATEPEQTGKSLTEISFDMMKGASVRANPAGIRFSATMSKTDWDDLKLYYGEENITFGAFIMPAQYQTTKGEFTLENLFGDADSSPIVNWEVDGEYTPETGKTRMIQMDSAIYEDTEISAMRVNGSITEIADKNLALDFVGVCYIKAGDDYKLATLNDNERNIVYVAQVAMDKEPQYATELQKVITAYQTYYAAKNDGATPTVSYTVKTYLNGVEHATENGTADLNATVELATPAAEINGYTYVASRSTTTGRALYGNKLVLELNYHKKAENVFYDFYDKEEAAGFYYHETYGKYEQFDGVDAVKIVSTEGEWGTAKFTNTGIDNAFNVSSAAYIYVYAYVKTPATDTVGTTRFTYHYYDGTNWDSSTFTTISVNTWNWLLIPIKAGSPNLAGVKFSFQRQPSGGSWQPIGKTEGEALYIREIGVISSSETTDFTKGFEDYTSMTRIFRSGDSSLYSMAISGNTNYVKEGRYSLRLYSSSNWVKYYFTEEFIAWIASANVKSFSFKLYYESTSSNKVTKIQYATGTQSTVHDWVYKNNPVEKTWYTFTMKDASILTSADGFQINKTTTSNVNVYIDDLIITYKQA